MSAVEKLVVEASTSKETPLPSIETLLNLEKEDLESQALAVWEKSPLPARRQDGVRPVVAWSANEHRTAIRCEVGIASETPGGPAGDLLAEHLRRMFLLVIFLPLTVTVMVLAGASVPSIVWAGFSMMSVIAVFGFVFKAVDVVSGNQSEIRLSLLRLLTLDSFTRERNRTPNRPVD